MKKRLRLYIFIISATSLLLFFIFTIKIINDNNLKITKESLQNYTKIYANNFINNHWNNQPFIANNIRVTVIDEFGNVIFESKNINKLPLDNHLNREEIINIKNNKSSFSIRHSDSTGEKLMYYVLIANKNNKNYFIRSAIPIENINKYIYQNIAFLFFILIIILILSIILTNKLNEKILRPFNIIKDSLKFINDGENIILNDHPIFNKYDDISQIISEIIELNNKIQNHIKEIQKEKDKLNFIINNINDGIFAVDRKKNIMLINKSIQNIFAVEKNVIGKNLAFLTSNKQLFRSIENSNTDKEYSDVFELKLNEKHYLINVKNISNYQKKKNEDLITVVILNDISQIKNDERLRSEFFANASHELKTPLTSIIGFNDLSRLKNKDSAISNYISQISVESQRMLSLIEDMLNLSLLESTNILNLTKLNLNKISTEVKESLLPIINEKNINFIINGNEEIEFNHKHLFQLIKNIAENAIKYNNDNGSVIISIFTLNNKVALKISDTGVGIDKRYHSLIFQRFYRIDKSRSKQNGGTGLGLAIVKHICLLYNVSFEIESQLNRGN
ncbi:ATP-binding protein [Fusobacterium sp. PH5-44]|uniref:sensor histidine kinase n=1 Tax=unclassified Fusobacterium TaxID=2648384 RepID=UPI003D21D7DE